MQPSPPIRRSPETVRQLARRRGGRGLYQKSTALQPLPEGKSRKRRDLPEYLMPDEIAALIRCAPNPAAALAFLIGWRAGLRVSEIVALEGADLQLDGDRPTLRVRHGKGDKERLVPCHPELRAALVNALAFGGRRSGLILPYSRSTVWRWLKEAQKRAVELGALPAGKDFGVHVLRHSFARHCLASGVPINYVSAWLGHESIETTLIYLRVLPDALGLIERVP